MRTLTTTDDVEIAVHDFGGSGAALLLAHATGFHGRTWRMVATELVDDFRVVAFDARGHGASSRPPDGDFRWSRLAADVLAVVDALDGGPILGVGHSSGGTALLLAEQARPGTFGAMWLYEPIVFPPAGEAGPPPGNVMADAARRRRAWFPSADEALATYRSKPPLASLHPEVLRDYVDHGFREADGGVTLACAPGDEAAVFAEARSHDAFERLGEVSCPVTVAGGEVSTIPPSLVRLVASRLPNGHAEILPGQGHLLPFEDPARVARLVRDALRPR